MNRSRVKSNCVDLGASDLFCRRLVLALGELSVRLQACYERRFPGNGSRIRKAIEEAEIEAWETPFPHLFFPDLAEEAIGRLGVSANLEVENDSTAIAPMA